MAEEIVVVQNVKCAGCVKTIREGLLALPGVSDAEVDQSSGRVTVQAEGLARAELTAKLAELGYPEAP